MFEVIGERINTSRISAKLTGTSPDKLGALTPRAPFSPVTLGQLANNFEQEKENENIKT